jgi:hypothetical protein
MTNSHRHGTVIDHGHVYRIPHPSTRRVTFLGEQPTNLSRWQLRLEKAGVDLVETLVQSKNLLVQTLLRRQEFAKNHFVL